MMKSYIICPVTIKKCTYNCTNTLKKLMITFQYELQAISGEPPYLNKNFYFHKKIFSAYLNSEK